MPMSQRWKIEHLTLLTGNECLDPVSSTQQQLFVKGAL